MSPRTWVLGDDVNTDEIIPGKFNLTTDPEELGKHVFAEARPGLAENLQVGDVLVGGQNFGCGSSREHAPISLKGAGISCVVAASFARIFFRNAVNVGLRILECPGAVQSLREGDPVCIDHATGKIQNERTGESFQAEPLPPFVAEIASAGGLVPFLRDRGWPS